MSAAPLSATSSHHDEYVHAATELAPLLAEDARAAELARQPSDRVIEAARDAGIFEMMVPAAYGGAELDLDTFFETVLVLAEADASAAWVISFYIEHNWMLCQFPEEFQRRLYTGRSHVLAPAMLSPTGTATAVPEGFRLDGRWQWATGIVHADWVIVGAIERDEARPRALFFALERDRVEVEDTWHMDGMCGTTGRCTARRWRRS